MRQRILLSVFLFCIYIYSEETTQTLHFVCKAGNDLFRAVKAGGTPCIRYDTVGTALKKTPAGEGVLILSGGYPLTPTDVPAVLFDRAKEKKLRLFVEYPASLPGLSLGTPVKTHVERVVVTSGFFGAELKKLRIAAANGLHYLPLVSGAIPQPHLVAARVAGFDHAIYGLPEKTSPVLFQLPGHEALIATTGLSMFVTGRYAPMQAWRAIWSAILDWINGATPAPPLVWTPVVEPAYRRDQKLPDDYELQAVRCGLAWYRNAQMIVHPSVVEKLAGKTQVESLTNTTPMGDGRHGALEAVLSVIHPDGSQRISTVQRGDCVCETAMALSLGGKLLNDAAYSAAGRNLLDYWMFTSPARKGERADPTHGAYGLIAWGVTNQAWYKANYGDDNARVMLGTLAAAAIHNESRWDEAVMMCLLANLRTTGKKGFRGGRIDLGALKNGWKPFFERTHIHLSPHYESYLWACFLWAYAQTGDSLFLDRAKRALHLTMRHYTDGWRWTNGLAQEKARILLPLAWLVRVEDTVEHRAMLQKAVSGLLKLQAPCGAIREELGIPGRGQYPPPGSNRAYGTNEASLIAQNGDPVADLLYTNNFAFLGLHEAAAATGDKEIRAAEDKLAQFLSRIQVRSETHKQLDGGWFRAFDFGRWEHWGCNADHGWGAWAIESGWTQGWITSVLSMRRLSTSLWELTHQSTIERHHEKLRSEMIPHTARTDTETK